MMNWYDILLWTQLLFCPVVLLSLLFISAPYGRHHRKGWGLKLDTIKAWVIMEFPAVATILVIFLCNVKQLHPANYVFIFLWEFHYLYRTFYFPFQLKHSKKSFPAMLVLFAILFNVINGYINGTYLFNLQPEISWNILTEVHFWIGLLVFCLGFVLHYHSDQIILNLRKDNSSEYAIPVGGMFKYVTNPNYLGEFIQWCGWAILTWSLPGLAFALFTFCNLFPRAIHNHRWYHTKFKDYPRERKRFFPFLY